MMKEQYEECVRCGEKTGRAGKGDDSLYIYSIGPFCQNCYDKVIEFDAYIKQNTPDTRFGNYDDMEEG